MRARIFGPISSESWNSKTSLGQVARSIVRCDPDGRFVHTAARLNLMGISGQLSFPGSKISVAFQQSLEDRTAQDLVSAVCDIDDAQDLPDLG